MGVPIFETEIRLRVVDSLAVRVALRRVASGDSFSVNVTDTWYVPVEYSTYQEHESWIESGLAHPVRVRVTHAPGGVQRAIQTKSINRSDAQRSTEVSLAIDDVDEAAQLLLCLGYRPIAIVEKTRDQFNVGEGLVCHLDEYPDFGCVLEIEVTSAESFTDPDILRGFARRVLLVDLQEISEPIPLRIVRAQLRSNS